MNHRILATAFLTKKTTRGIFLQQNISAEEVTDTYFRSALFVIKANGKTIVIVDIIGSKVLWGYESKKYSYSAAKTRWSKIITNHKGKRGFYIRGNFIEL